MATFTTPTTTYTPEDLTVTEKNTWRQEMGVAAETAVQAAQSTADGAQASASQALGTAVIADREAVSAQSTADTALTTANAAVKRTSRDVSISPTGSTVTLDFATKDSYQITIVDDIEISFSNVPSGQNVDFIVFKPIDKIVTFSGVSLSSDGIQIGDAYLWYRLNNIQGTKLVSRIDTQISGSLSAGDLSITAKSGGTGSMAIFEFFNWTINNNICTLEAKMVLSTSPDDDTYYINLSNFNIYTFNEHVSLTVFCLNSDYIILARYNNTANRIELKVIVLSGISSLRYIIISGSFRIK